MIKQCEMSSNLLVIKVVKGEEGRAELVEVNQIITKQCRELTSGSWAQTEGLSLLGDYLYQAE